MTNAVHQIELGGITLHGDYGQLTFSDHKGLYGLPDVRGMGDPIPQGHGSFKRAETWRASRAVTIEGMLHETDRYRAEQLRNHLSNAWESAETIRVTDEVGVWSMGVESVVADFPDFGAWARDIPFVIDMIAPDPVRYRDPLTLGPIGLPVRSGGLTFPAAFPWHFGDSVRPVGTLVNDGARLVLPRITMSGAADSVIAHGGPRRLEFGAFSGMLVFDSLERRAWLNGVDVTRQMVRRDWPVVPPGETQDFFFEAVNPSPDTVLESVVYKIGAW